SYVASSKYELAIPTLREAVELSHRTPVAVACLAEAYAAAGFTDEALEVLRELLKPMYVTSYFVARVYAALGKDDEALRSLETASRERAEWLVLLPVDARLDNLRADGRFQNLLRSMNFPEI